MSRINGSPIHCPAPHQDGKCIGTEACHARREGDGCPCYCDGCGDVTEDINDEGLCVECR